MGSGSISSASVPALSKDLGRNKKKANKLGKLEKCKLDVRREKCLSQVNSMGCSVNSSGMGGSTSIHILSNERNRSSDESESRSRRMEHEGLSLDDRDLQFLINHQASDGLGHDNIRKRRGSSSSSSSSSSSDSRSANEEEDECLDDWEAIADALTLSDNARIPVLETCIPSSTAGATAATPEPGSPRVGLSKTNCRTQTGSQPISRAWRPDDAFRPRSLPSLSNQHSLPPDGHCNRGTPWAWQTISHQISSCPICCEDFDLTDSNFLPCACGFRLCLFCHKRILEADGRCPGCRNKYENLNRSTCFNENTKPFHMTRSCSTNSRS